MQYSPKLKAAMEEIKQILKKHDIAGAIVIHTPGHTEYHLRIDPTYSCARIDGESIRVKASLKDLGKNAFTRITGDTANMLHGLGTCMGGMSLNIFDISDELDKTTNAEHFGGGHTSHTQQNN
ncbi:MAG: hypothetical protein WC756_12145 [Taibaiella sp.]|jgi:hypothetical protein